MIYSPLVRLYDPEKNVSPVKGNLGEYYVDLS